MTAVAGVVRTSWLAEGRILRVALARPPRNVLDGEMLAALTAAVAPLGTPEGAHLCAVLLTSEGAHFSYGADVAEHDRARAPAMLAAFSRAVRALVVPCVPIVAAVRGQCLGGGLELASLATRLVAHVDARLGQPEIRLAALAPVASVVLPRRIGQRRAEDLLLTGRVVGAADAVAMGLVDAATLGDPEPEALAWIQECLLPHSAAVLRMVCRASRLALLDDLDHALPKIVQLYERELLPTADAEEGIRAFLEKRAPTWSDR